MGQIIRCPLTGLSCGMPITIQEKSFFLAKAEKPEDDKKRRIKAISEAIGDGYKIRSALEEKSINAFTCKICEMIQTCAYGMADVTQRNPNVLLELGMMVALGKPTIILSKRGEEQELKLPSDLSAIEIIPFTEYIDIIDQLREVVAKLPPAISPPSPIEDLEKIQPRLAEELKRMEADIVKEFKESVVEAKLDTISAGEEEKAISPEIGKRLIRLEEKLEDLKGLGFVTDPQTAFLRGNYYHNQGKYKEALASYNWVLELRPDDPDTLFNRGTTYHYLERYEEALADYNRSLELRPDDPDVFFNLACLFSRWRKINDALSYLEKAIKGGEKYRELAKTDTDFDNIRDNPRFKKLMESK